MWLLLFQTVAEILSAQSFGQCLYRPKRLWRYSRDQSAQQPLLTKCPSSFMPFGRKNQVSALLCSQCGGQRRAGSGMWMSSPSLNLPVLSPDAKTSRVCHLLFWVDLWYRPYIHLVVSTWHNTVCHLVIFHLLLAFDRKGRQGGRGAINSRISADAWRT